ncbi:hypothetical protein TeGR_g14047, partial [Tetraparma gracilis]
YFHEQHQEDLAAHRSAYAYAYAKDKPLMLMPDGSEMTSAKLLRMEATPLASDEFDLHVKGPLGGAKYEGKNALMMYPEAYEEPAEDRKLLLKNEAAGAVGAAALVKSRAKAGSSSHMPPPPPRPRGPLPPTASLSAPAAIQPENTRFPPEHHFNEFLKETGSGIDRRTYEESHATSEYSYDSSSKKKGDYRYVDMTPSFKAGEADIGSPIMTYGEIGATPLATHRDDDGLGRGHLKTLMRKQPDLSDTYQLKGESSRERAGRELADKARPNSTPALFPGGSVAASANNTPSIFGARSVKGGRKKDSAVNLTPAAQSLLQRSVGRGGALVGNLPTPNASVRGGGSFGSALRQSYSVASTKSRKEKRRATDDVRTPAAYRQQKKK